MWKRIPDNVKGEHPELKKIWAVGIALWNRDLSAVYSSLDQTWSEGVAKIMATVKGIEYSDVTFNIEATRSREHYRFSKFAIKL